MPSAPQFVATRILNINERDQFSSKPTDEQQLRRQDDEIFNRARLVNWCVLAVPLECYSDIESWLQRNIHAGN